MRQAGANTGANPDRCSSKQKGHPDQAGSHAAQAEKTYLAVAHFEDLLKQAAPAGRRKKWQQPFDHQHNGERQPERAAIQGATTFWPGQRLRQRRAWF